MPLFFLPVLYRMYRKGNIAFDKETVIDGSRFLMYNKMKRNCSEQPGVPAAEGTRKRDTYQNDLRKCYQKGAVL